MSRSSSISALPVTSLNLFALFLILDLYTPLASAQSSNSTGTGTDDGGAASGVGPGDIGSGSGSDSQSSTNAGAAGPDTGAVNLSRGATVAIAVVVSIVVVLGILYFLAKKRHWKVKEGLRRSARRVGSAVKSVTTPITPKRMHFPSQRRGQGQGFARYPLSGRPAGARHTRPGDDDLEKGTPAPIVRDLNVESEHESGSEREVAEPGKQNAKKKVGNDDNANSGEGAEKQKPKPKPPAVSIPSSSFELDTSGSGIPQTPMWKKVFGR
ncbi:hypothetical protein HRR78_004103 [Exophiala dermatitidis]|nr:hypothetical protein HRR75_006679 [Exophiala dermatitidis]KAJ4551426.1 hypothetical protein HRR78_004103 [Exophiala dermatitidis]